MELFELVFLLFLSKKTKSVQNSEQKIRGFINYVRKTGHDFQLLQKVFGNPYIFDFFECIF